MSVAEHALQRKRVGRQAHVAVLGNCTGRTQMPLKTVLAEVPCFGRPWIDHAGARPTPGQEMKMQVAAAAAAAERPFEAVQRTTGP